MSLPVFGGQGRKSMRPLGNAFLNYGFRLPAAGRRGSTTRIPVGESALR